MQLVPVKVLHSKQHEKNYIQEHIPFIVQVHAALQNINAAYPITGQLRVKDAQTIQDIVEYINLELNSWHQTCLIILKTVRLTGKVSSFSVYGLF